MQWTLKKQKQMKKEEATEKVTVADYRNLGTDVAAADAQKADYNQLLLVMVKR